MQNKNSSLLFKTIPVLENFVRNLYKYKEYLSAEEIKEVLIQYMDLLKSLYEMTGENEKVQKVAKKIEELEKELN